jgi:AraC family transcriptional regulator, regulatory protein of adaptative response / methylated-DNA-[protein]-cysteine methyltransferase
MPAHETLRYATRACALGRVLLAATPEGAAAILLGDNDASLVKELGARFPGTRLVRDGRGLEEWMNRVTGFLKSPRDNPALPLDARGTDFQRKVWNALREIPCGTTGSYREIARCIGVPGAARAVAAACAANPLAVVIPCHRVVRADGGLAGYRWGVWRKRELLATERRLGYPDSVHCGAGLPVRKREASGTGGTKNPAVAGGAM